MKKQARKQPRKQPSRDKGNFKKSPICSALTKVTSQNLTNCMQTMQLYESSGHSGAMSHFAAPTSSPSEAGVANRENLTARSQALVRNNTWFSRSLKVHVANEIGEGITPVATTHDDIFNKEIAELWKDHNPYFCKSRSTNAYGLQALAVRTRKESGESFIIMMLNPDAKLSPVSFQVVEPEYCPYELNTIADNGNEIKYGIEFNSDNAVVAYWFYKYHPLDLILMKHGNELYRIEAKNVIHHYIPKRAGELRPAPEMLRGIVKAYLYDKYDSSELVRKDTRAQFTGVIERTGDDARQFGVDPLIGQEVDDDNPDDEVPVLELEAGTFPSLNVGESLNLFDGDDSGRGYADFQRNQLLGVAASTDTPHAFVTGDFSGINDRIARVILNQYQREISQDQHLFTIPQVCQVMWEFFVAGCVFHGLVSTRRFQKHYLKYMRCEHRTHAWAYIHPLQDVQAHSIAVRNGFASRKGVVSGMNGDVEQMDKERGDDFEREKAMGLISESVTEYGLDHPDFGVEGEAGSKVKTTKGKDDKSNNDSTNWDTKNDNWSK